MEKSRGKIDDSVRDYVAEKRQSLEQHPEIETLTAYRHGELSDAAVEEVRDHLTLCEECGNLLLDLASFSELEPPSEAYRLSEQDVAEQTVDLLERIDAEEDSGGKVLSFTPRSPAPPATREVRVIPGWYHAIAASFLAAAVGLGLWNASLHQQIGSGNPRVIQLTSVANVFRGFEDSENFPASREQGLVLQLLYDEDIAYHQYRVMVHDADGGELMNRGGYKRMDESYISIDLPLELRIPGAMRIKLFGLADEEEKLVAEYELNLSPDAPPSA